MLLSFNFSNETALHKLFEFAKLNKLDLKMLYEDDATIYLPGKALNKKQLKSVIEKSRKSGTVSMKDAGKIIREELS